MPHASKQRAIAKASTETKAPRIDLTGITRTIPAPTSNVLLTLTSTLHRDGQNQRIQLASYHPSIESAKHRAFSITGQYRYEILAIDKSTGEIEAEILKGQTYKGIQPTNRKPRGKVNKIKGSDGNRGRIIYNFKGSLPVSSYIDQHGNERAGFQVITGRGRRKIVRKRLPSDKLAIEQYREDYKKTHSKVTPIESSRILESLEDSILASNLSGAMLGQNAINKAHLIGIDLAKVRHIDRSDSEPIAPSKADLEIPSHAQGLPCACEFCDC